MTTLIPRRPRARLVALASVVGVVLVVLSPLFGRADVSGSYRPLVPADGLTNGCYPLPGGVELDFPYVLRRDGDVVDAQGIRRRVVLHFDEIGAAEATAVAEGQFRDAGVLDQVSVTARDFEGLPEGSVIRGEMVLDLPSIGRQSDASVCDDIYSTKRFTPDLPDRS